MVKLYTGAPITTAYAARKLRQLPRACAQPPSSSARTSDFCDRCGRLLRRQIQVGLGVRSLRRPAPHDFPRQLPARGKASPWISNRLGSSFMTSPTGSAAEKD